MYMFLTALGVPTPYRGEFRPDHLRSFAACAIRSFYNPIFHVQCRFFLSDGSVSTHGKDISDVRCSNFRARFSGLKLKTLHQKKSPLFRKAGLFNTAAPSCRLLSVGRTFPDESSFLAFYERTFFSYIFYVLRYRNRICRRNQ